MMRIRKQNTLDWWVARDDSIGGEVRGLPGIIYADTPETLERGIQALTKVIEQTLTKGPVCPETLPVLSAWEQNSFVVRLEAVEKFALLFCDEQEWNIFLEALA